MGQFANLRKYPTAAFKEVTAPNADTLYSAAWLDLSKGPWVLHVPDENGRYYLMPMLDGWTNVFADPGKRTTGTQAGDFAIIGPNWEGELPDGVKALKSPTNMVWIIGRTYCTGTPEDYQAVHAIQDKYSLTPLSAWGKQYAAPARVPVDPKVDMKTPPRDQVNRMSAGTFFQKLARLMKDNPPADADAPMVAKLARLGIVPGQGFDIKKLGPAPARGLQAGAQDGLKQIVAEIPRAGKDVNGWRVTLTGEYGTNYLFRSAIAFAGLGANLPQDACYPTTGVDAAGKPLDGAHRYVMHFANKGALPPVDGFWSLTMYDAQYFFVANPLNRYTLSQRNDLKASADGSIDLYLQHDSPGKDRESNWLPAPKGRFVLMLRLYWPKELFLDGTWQPPAVRRVP
jgi:DNA sulfur modification protein DndE